MIFNPGDLESPGQMSHVIVTCLALANLKCPAIIQVSKLVYLRCLSSFFKSNLCPNILP